MDGDPEGNTPTVKQWSKARQFVQQDGGEGTMINLVIAIPQS
jgi:hypothetical protein